MQMNVVRLVIAVWVLAGALQFSGFAYEVVPTVVDVEAGGGGSQVLVRGDGAETLYDFKVTKNGANTSYLLARAGGKAAGQITVVIQAREDAPRDAAYGLSIEGTVLPLKIRVVEMGAAQNTGRPAPSDRDIREVVRDAQTRQIVVSSDQAPQVLSTIPAHLRIAPDGVAKQVRLIGKRLETIDDVRVRKADKPAKYRGKKGKLPFRLVQGMLEVELMASRSTALGEQYVLDLMIGKFKAVSVPFEIGDPGVIQQVPTEQAASDSEGPTVIRLPDSASE
jgi:hypothetical protein